MMKVNLTISISAEVADELVKYVQEHHAVRSQLVEAWIREKLCAELVENNKTRAPRTTTGRSGMVNADG